MYKYARWFVVMILMLVLIGGMGYGEEWLIYGPKAQGMGGAGVAVGDAATAPYWNPAALTLKDTKGFYLPFGTTIGAEGDILKYTDKVFKDIQAIDWSAVSNNIDNGKPLTLNDTKNLLNLFVNDIPQMSQPGQGLLLNLYGGAMLTIGSVGISMNVFGYGGLDSTVDVGTMSFSSGATPVANIVPGAVDRSAAFTNAGSQSLADAIFALGGFTQVQAEELVYQAELAGVDTSDPTLRNLVTSIAQATAGGTSTVTLNASGITLSGIALKEAGISYARPVMDNLLSIGGTIKIMEGETYYKFIQFDNMESGDDSVSGIDSKANKKTSTTFGIDAGALLSLTDSLKLGLVGRNLNKPKFAWLGPGDYAIDPQLRLGAAFKLGDTITLAADYDLTKNKTDALSKYESQVVGGGIEINLIGSLKLRGGMYKNVASSLADPVYTAGVGIHLIFLDVDLAVARSTGKVQIESGSGGTSEIAERYSAALSIAIRF